MPEYLKVDEVANLLRISKGDVYRKCMHREIPFIKLGGRSLFDTDKLREWIEEHAVPATAR